MQEFNFSSGAWPSNISTGAETESGAETGPCAEEFGHAALTTMTGVEKGPVSVALVSLPATCSREGTYLGHDGSTLQLLHQPLPPLASGNVDCFLEELLCVHVADEAFLGEVQLETDSQREEVAAVTLAGKEKGARNWARVHALLLQALDLVLLLSGIKLLLEEVAPPHFGALFLGLSQPLGHVSN